MGFRRAYKKVVDAWSSSKLHFAFKKCRCVCCYFKMSLLGEQNLKVHVR